MLRRLIVLFVFGLGGGCQCGGTPPLAGTSSGTEGNSPAGGGEDFRRETDVPWTPGNGRLATIHGRVVTPEGAAVAGATVQLVYPGDPHWGESVAYQTHTNAQGHFRVEDVSAYVPFDLVVTENGGRRTFVLPPVDYPPSEGERPAVSVRVAPMHSVDVEVVCTEEPKPIRPRLPEEGSPPSVSVYWLPESDLIASIFPPSTGPQPALGGGPSMSRARPGHSTHLPAVPGSARRFQQQIKLPAGRHKVVVTGQCGVVQKEIDISETGPNAVQVEAPVPNYGNLVLRLAADSNREYVQPEVRYAGRHIAIGEDRRLYRGRWARIHYLEPGLYDVGGVTCHEPIDVAAERVTRVEIGPGRCDVTYGRR